jgi:hypothetical protein
MVYRVKTITIQTGFFGSINKDKMDAELEDELNSLSQEGYEIVSICPLMNDSRDFDYQVIYRKR